MEVAATFNSTLLGARVAGIVEFDVADVVAPSLSRLHVKPFDLTLVTTDTGIDVGVYGLVTVDFLIAVGRLFN